MSIRTHLGMRGEIRCDHAYIAVRAPPGGHLGTLQGRSSRMDSAGFHDLLRKAQSGDRSAMDEVVSLIIPQIERVASRFPDPIRPVARTWRGHREREKLAFGMAPKWGWVQ